MKILYIVIILLVVSPPVALGDEHPTKVRTIVMKDSELKAGEQAMRAGNLELAIEKFLAGLPTASSRRSESAALNNLCAAYGTLGQFETALHYCERALVVRPNNWRAHQNRARSLIGIGELDAAIESANKGLEIAPNAAPLHEILALAYSFKRKPHVIIDTFEADTKK